MSVSPAINMTPISIAPAPPMPIHICLPPSSNGPVRIGLVAATIATAPRKIIANAAFCTADFSASFRTRGQLESGAKQVNEALNDAAHAQARISAFVLVSPILKSGGADAPRTGPGSHVGGNASHRD
jgi:hypothetical protein